MMESRRAAHRGEEPGGGTRRKRTNFCGFGCADCPRAHVSTFRARARASARF